MKTYTLSLNALSVFDEVIETIKYLDENFPGLMQDNVQKYIDNPNDNGYGEENRNRFAVIVAFNKFFFDQDESKRQIMSMIHGANKAEAEGRLASDFSLTVEYLDSQNVNIETAVEKGILVAVNYINFTDREIATISECLSSYNGNISLDAVKAIKDKLYGRE